MPDGKKVVASKRIQEFTVNFPSTFLIPTGEHRVYVIRLGKEWETRLELAVDAETQITLKAVGFEKGEVGRVHVSWGDVFHLATLPPIGHWS